MAKLRLNKILAQAGRTSRRGGDRLILEGRVAVNGAVAREPGTLADPLADIVTVDGRPLAAREPLHYVLLNKPAGYVTSRHDPRGRAVVTDLVPAAVRLYPVGRLDYDVEGALLLTNDGPLTHRLLHPRYGLARLYEVSVRGRVSAADLPRWRQGVTLEDGRACPTSVELVRGGANESLLRVAFTEGRKHEVKRYAEALGHRVLHLRRIAFGPLHLGALPRGRSRPLSPAEVRALRRAVSQEPPG
jgi:23S rRNA pseudouridine2605 synthase